MQHLGVHGRASLPSMWPTVSWSTAPSLPTFPLHATGYKHFMPWGTNFHALPGTPNSTAPNSWSWCDHSGFQLQLHSSCDAAQTSSVSLLLRTRAFTRHARQDPDARLLGPVRRAQNHEVSNRRPSSVATIREHEGQLRSQGVRRPVDDLPARPIFRSGVRKKTKTRTPTRNPLTPKPPTSERRSLSAPQLHPPSHPLSEGWEVRWLHLGRVLLEAPPEHG